MKGYYIKHKVTSEQEVIFGRTYARACISHNIDPNEWELMYETYED